MGLRQCSICRDGRDRYVCGACRRDPANDGWVEPSRTMEVAPRDDDDGAPGLFTLADLEIRAPGPGGVKTEYTKSERKIAAGIWAGQTDTEIAKTTGLSRALVRRVRAMFMGDT